MTRVQILISPAIVSGLKEIIRVETTHIIQFVIDANWGGSKLSHHKVNVSFQWKLFHANHNNFLIAKQLFWHLFFNSHRRMHGLVAET